MDSFFCALVKGLSDQMKASFLQYGLAADGVLQHIDVCTQLRLAAFVCPIPAGATIVGVEDTFPPSVVDTQTEMFHATCIAQHTEYVVRPVTIWCEGIGYPDIAEYLLHLYCIRISTTFVDCSDDILSNPDAGSPKSHLIESTLAGSSA
jgi:hypothetical protein